MKNISLLFVLTFFLFFSCKKANTDECLEYRQATIVKVTVPDSAILNQSVIINASFLIENGCGAFHKFEQTTLVNTINVQAIVRYEGCQCTAMASTIDTSFVFNPSARGKYIFHFLQDNTTLMNDTIVIF